MGTNTPATIAAARGQIDRLLKEADDEWRRATGSEKHVDYGFFARFLAHARHLISVLAGPNSGHLREFESQQERTAKSAYYMDYLPAFAGILQAVRDDLDAGTLVDLRGVLRSEIFADFLDQATHLLSEGHTVAAAAVAGAVLEDSLRKMADKHQVTYSTPTTINALNQALYKAQIYDAGVMKRITAEADLRNTAAHGHFDRVAAPDVEAMIRWIVRFTSEYLP